MSDTNTPQLTPTDSSRCCEKCGVDMFHRFGAHLFLLKRKLWNRIRNPKHPDRLLCVPCCESVLGRKLRRNDFEDRNGYPATPLNIELRANYLCRSRQPDDTDELRQLIRMIGD